MLFRSHFVKPLALLSLIASFCAAFASPAAHAAEAGASGEDYDFSWLDPDKKIYVVQNRKYLKQNRLELSLAGGLGFGEAYRTRRTFMPRVIYYVSEQFGASVFGGFNRNNENGNVKDLQDSGSGRIPAVRDVNSFIGASVMWMPFYGKVNLFNQILYLDWHFEVGVSQMSTEINLNTLFTGNPIIETGSYMGFHWGTGQKFFITRNWAARLDFMAQYYKAPVGVMPGSNGAPLQSSSGTPTGNYDNYYATLGVSYTF